MVVVILPSEDTSKKWYDYNQIHGYDCLYNFILSARSEGKTYGFKKWAVSDYLKNGNEFGYLLRHDTDFTANENFFDKLVENKEFPGWEFRADSVRAYIRKHKPAIKNEDGLYEEQKQDKWVCFGYFFALSKQQTYKGNEYPRINKLCYDEFIKEKGVTRYLPNEVNDMHNLYITIDRKKWKLKVFFLANTADIVNPFLMYYNVTLKDLKNKEFIRCGLKNKRKAVVHMYHNPDSKKEITEKGLDDLFSDDYLGYAFEGSFSEDSDRFIRKMPSTVKYRYAIFFDGNMFSIWLDLHEGDYYFTRKKPPNDKNVFTLTRSDHRPNMFMIERNSTIIKKLKQLYSFGYLYFDNPQTRSLANEMFARLGWN